MTESTHIIPSLAISTGHLDPTTAAQMQHGETFDIGDVLVFEYGYVLFTAAIEAMLDTKSNTVPVCLSKIAEIAAEKDCRIIVLDRDADLYEGLEDYDW